MDNQFLSVAEMAKVLNIGLSKAYEMIHWKDFPALRLGRRIVIPYDELQQWVKKNLGLK